MTTLPDLLSPNLDILSVGLNPSLNAVKAGFYFATPQNRFWKALNASALIDKPLTPSIESQQTLLTNYRMGFTDTVKRPTSQGSALRSADFRTDCPILKEKILKYSPRIVWFHGKVAYKNYLVVTENIKGGVDWGEQPWPIGSAQTFVTPNPSPANAAFSLANLIDWYNKLADFRKARNENE